MKLETIEITNYRSIEYLQLNCTAQNDGSFTFGLIGLNEAGKSSVLKAIALMDSLIPITAKDFQQKKGQVDITFRYRLDEEHVELLKEFLGPLKYGDTKWEDFDFSEVEFSSTYELPDLGKKILLSAKSIVENAKKRFILPKAFPDFVHRCIFWTAEDKYLISHPISLASFSANPEGTSVPLRNCFLLAGITDIKERIGSLDDDSTEIELLQTELGEKVTEHIRSVWPNHPIEITFLITNGLIHFHVRDLGATGKAKTADQRSDGFKQFVSFLLTISAQNKNEELSQSILLLDEPETHLHPLAQEYLLTELIKISRNDRRNLALFATHSNYMIDKRDLSRNFRVTKENDLTDIVRLDRQISTYASVTFEVFGIASSDYHNELYARLHEAFQDEDPGNREREYIKTFDSDFFHTRKGLPFDKPFRGTPDRATLPTFIRNCIHHPENGDQFSENDLRQSIGIMRS